MVKHNYPELKYRTVVVLKPRQDVNAVADKIYRINFDSTDKIKIREYKRSTTEIVYLVADFRETQPLYLIKKLRHGVQPESDRQKNEEGDHGRR